MQLEAGAFDVDPERGRAFAISQGLDPARSDGSYQDLIAGEAGLLWSSQVAIGNSNAVRLRVFGDKGSLQWFQEQPNELVLTPLDGRVQIIKRGADDLSEAAKLRIRTPPAIPRTIWKSLPTSMPAWPR